MSHSPIRPVVAVGLVATVLTYVGCVKTHETSEKAPDARPTPVAAPPASKPEPDPQASKADPGPKFFDDWAAKPPLAILLVSGEQLGYPEPCGCTDGQLGGLGRRLDLVEKLRAKGWPVGLVDLGNLTHYHANSRGGRRQEQIKFQVILQGLASMKYDSVALGPDDLKLGIFDTLGVLMNPIKDQPKFLAANVKLTEPAFAEVIRPSSVFPIGPVSIGTTAVLDPEAYRQIQDANAAYLEVGAPDDVLGATLADLEKRSEIQVLLVQGPPEEAKRLGEKFPGFDLVVATSRYDEPESRPEPLNGGKTLLINVGKKGKYSDLVGIYPARGPGEAPTLDFRAVALRGQDFRQAPEMTTLINVDYQRMLKDARIVEDFPRSTNTQAPPGAKYVGADSCQACHPNAYQKWSTTKHAKAYDALTSNPKRNREHDAECVSCHTTGFNYKTGFASAEATPFLKGNQCENCHGPGSLHVADPANEAFSKPMGAMTAEAADNTNFCIKCHDEDNDHNFKFEGRYAQIYHKGLDDLKNPEIRKPQPPKADPK